MTSKYEHLRDICDIWAHPGDSPHPNDTANVLSSGATLARSLRYSRSKFPPKYQGRAYLCSADCWGQVLSNIVASVLIPSGLLWTSITLLHSAFASFQVFFDGAVMEFPISTSPSVFTLICSGVSEDNDHEWKLSTPPTPR